MLVFKTLTSLTVTSVALTLGLAAGSAAALSLADGAQPAEFPPASFSGDVYVDSRGCIYIRAGVAGAVTWVPRVSRGRTVVCGAQPSLAASARVAAAPAPAPIPVPIPVPAPAPVPASAPAPAETVSTEITRTLTLTCPAGGSDARVRSNGVSVPLRCDAGQVGTISYIVAHGNGERTRVVVNPAPAAASAPARVVAAPVPAPTPAPVISPVVRTTTASAVVAPAPVTRIVHITCPERQGISRMYTNDGRVIPVRCGPQTVAPVTYIVTHSDGERTRVVASPATAAAAPVATRSVAAAAPVVTPEGYRPAWTDGRLNPNRGPQTASGNAQMDLLWTRTVPRKLIDTTTGRDMTAKFRNIRYPDMPSRAQVAAVAAGNTVLMTSSPTRARTRAPASATPAAATPAAANHRYVQVGTFGVPANAQRTIAQLQGLGLPVKIGNVTRSGKAYQVVVAGPFSAQAGLSSALAKVRAAGFSDAFLRK